jgi:2-keto-4-pentenoate hydratase/2-oxohepta-3-ene-1,7-dioic acid hydratase in catechol pathway
VTIETTPGISATPAIEGGVRGPAYGLVTFVRPGGQPETGLVVGGGVAPLDAPNGMTGLLADWERTLPRLDAMAERVAAGEPTGLVSLTAVDLRAPVPRPGKMLYAAANYEGHLRAALRALGIEMDTIDKSRIRPYSFVKLSSAVVGPYDPIVIGPDMTSVDWEVELALVVGRGGRNIPVEEAMDHVAGYMVANDVSCRDRAMRDDWPVFRSDWLASKSFDTFAPLGPCLVPRHLVADPLDLHMTLRVNGRVRQDAKTSGMVFTPAEQVAYASSITTLEPGDVIATGTPDGTGMETGEFLAPGDVVEAEITGLGCQRNMVVAQV